MSYNIAEYVVEWLSYGLQDGENMADLLQTIIVWFTNVRYEHTKTDKPTITKGDNAMGVLTGTNYPLTSD